MTLRTIEQAPGAKTADAPPTLHAFVVGPAVGSMVLLLAFVGLAAAAFGAFSGLARNHGIAKRERQTPP